MTKRKLYYYIGLAAILLGMAYFVYHYRLKIIKIGIPFFMALVIAYLLNPLVKKLERHNIKRSAGILIIYLCFFVITSTFIIFVIPELINNTRELTVTIPEVSGRLQNLINGLMSAISSYDWSPEFKNAVFTEVQNGAEEVQMIVINYLKRALNVLVETVAAMFDLILAMIVAYYFIKDSDFFKNFVLSLTPRRWRNGIISTGREIHAILSNFIQGQLLTALIVGSMEMTGLWLVKVKYPLILGLIGGLANIIPYFGPIIGAIPAVAIAIIDSPVKALWTVLVFVVIQQVDNAFISPKIIEGRLGLHPVTTILVVLIGGEFFGVAGMLVSVPVAAIIKVIVRRVIESIV